MFSYYTNVYNELNTDIITFINNSNNNNKSSRGSSYACEYPAIGAM